MLFTDKREGGRVLRCVDKREEVLVFALCAVRWAVLLDNESEGPGVGLFCVDFWMEVDAWRWTRGRSFVGCSTWHKNVIGSH